MDKSQVTKIFKALSDERRIEILELLDQDEMCACKLLEALEISQSTLSHHMKILCESNIVNNRREGKWAYYSLNLQGCKTAVDLLLELTKCETTLF